MRVSQNCHTERNSTVNTRRFDKIESKKTKKKPVDRRKKRKSSSNECMIVGDNINDFERVLERASEIPDLANSIPLIPKKK